MDGDGAEYRLLELSVGADAVMRELVKLVIVSPKGNRVAVRRLI